VCIYIYITVYLSLFSSRNKNFQSHFLSSYQSLYRPTPLLVPPTNPCLFILFFLLPLTMSDSSSSNASPAFSIPNFPTSFSVKLDEGNYIVWLSLVVPILKSHDMMGIVDGSNHAHLKLLQILKTKKCLILTTPYGLERISFFLAGSTLLYLSQSYLLCLVCIHQTKCGLL
jgi:hypothetical protein